MLSIEMLIVIPLVLIMLLMILNVYASLEEERSYRDIIIKTTTIGDSLIENRGYPENWNHTNVERIGLCEYRGIINSNRLMEFAMIDNETLKEATEAGKYNVLIDIKYLNGSTINISGNMTRIGVPPPGNISEITNVFVLRDYALYNQERVIIEVTAWD